jgi:peptidoglycan LD-endopeptidase LytH
VYCIVRTVDWSTIRDPNRAVYARYVICKRVSEQCRATATRSGVVAFVEATTFVRANENVICNFETSLRLISDVHNKRSHLSHRTNLPQQSATMDKDDKPSTIEADSKRSSSLMHNKSTVYTSTSLLRLSLALLLMTTHCKGLTVAGRSYAIPTDQLQAFGSYPNPLDLTDEDRRSFSPVIKPPLSCEATASIESPTWRVADWTIPHESTELATLEEIQEARQVKQETGSVERFMRQMTQYSVGRYDENRVGLYTSSLFGAIDAANRRTLHIGIDLGAPVGTPVYAFAKGRVLHVGYNEAHGDYGYVVVIKHELSTRDGVDRPPLYALYGHLDAITLEYCRPDGEIQAGQQIGGLGDVTENGGWKTPHVHFQLAINPPETHDMPGVVTLANREQALVDYPDPRYVLGELY